MLMQDVFPKGLVKMISEHQGNNEEGPWMFLFPVSLIDQSQWTWMERATWNVPCCRFTPIQLMNVNKSNGDFKFMVTQDLK